MKKVFGLALLLVAGFTLAACNEEPTFDFEKGVLVVGMECAYPPFNWTITSGNEFTEPIEGTSLFCDGYDVQMARALADEMELELEIQAIDWDGLIPALRSGSIDAIIAGMSPTSERAQVISFSDEYYRSTHVVVLQQSSAYASGTTLDDFAGARGVGQLGTVYDDLIPQLNGIIHEPAMSSVPAIVGAISSGTVDLTIVELPVALGIIASNPTFTYIEIAGGFDIADEDAVVSIAVRKGDTLLRDAFNNVLATITEQQRNTWMLDAIERQIED